MNFLVLTAHTSPSVNVQELGALEFFFREAEAGDEPDVIVLSDLNADCSYLRASDNISFRQPGYFWVVGDDSDTTVSKTDCAYDRFIFKNQTVEDYTGYWGIYTNITDEVSDHYLVWAEFTTTGDTD